MEKKFLLNSGQKNPTPPKIKGSYLSFVLEKVELVDCRDKNLMSLKMKTISSVRTLSHFSFPLNVTVVMLKDRPLILLTVSDGHFSCKGEVTDLLRL